MDIFGMSNFLYRKIELKIIKKKNNLLTTVGTVQQYTHFLCKEFM